MVCDEVLGCLLERSGSWISGEDIASKLGITRAAVWKQIQSLRSRGYIIESSTNRGYRLSSLTDLLDPGLIGWGLETSAIGKRIHCYKVLDSTNATAKEMAKVCESGTVVLADVQREGRGRVGRSWSSPPGGVWISVILKPNITPQHVGRINIAVSVAVARTVYELYGIRAGIKWPNDITIRGRKLGGILTEISAEMERIEYAVVGIGINANVDLSEFPPEWNATSIMQELGSGISRVELIQHLLTEIERYYEMMTASFEEMHREWCNLSTTLGRYVRIESQTGEVEGRAISLDQEGALILRVSDGEIKRVLTGDCVHLRMVN